MNVDLEAKNLLNLEFNDFEDKIENIKYLEFNTLEESVTYFKNSEEGIVDKKIFKLLKKENVETIICDKLLVNPLKNLNYDAIFNQNILKTLKKYQEELFDDDFFQTYLGLSHLLSRKNISSDIGREDSFVVQSIIMIDQLDIDINLYSIRLKELYGWYFPELERLKSTEDYVLCAAKMGKIRSKSKEEIEKIAESCDIDVDVIFNSIGVEITELDWDIIINLNKLLREKIDNKNDLNKYLKKKLENIAPNLSELVGDRQAARLIQYAGSIQNLALYSSSTIQLLGAEKALFKSLKAKTVTPKYGILYNTGLVQSTKTKYRGRLCRSLASKCAIAARLDTFMMEKTNKYGKAMKKLLVLNSSKYDTNEIMQTTNDVLSKIINKN